MFPKRGTIALGLTAVALVLLVSFRTPDDAGLTATRGTGSATIGSGGTTKAQTNAGAGTRTVDGTTVDTRFGPVQVRVTMDGSTITDVVAIQLPDGDGRSASISSRVEPTLRSQALETQSADIDGVSGATYTSIAYARSLQSALDSAGG